MDLVVKNGILDLSEKGLIDLSILKEVENPNISSEMQSEKIFDLFFSLD